MSQQCIKVKSKQKQRSYYAPNLTNTISKQINKQINRY